MYDIKDKLNLETVKSRKHNREEFYQNIHTFDIEVTNYKEGETIAGIVYLWTYAIDENNVFYGRTIADFVDFLNELIDCLDPQIKQVVFVHNLAYEFQFIRHYFEWSNVFVTDLRKPLYAQTKNIEFRCSYLLANMSLDNFLKNSEVPIQKLSLDYSVYRYPWTKLDDDILTYCKHDTLGLLQAINRMMDKEKLNITTLPLTSTGFVRKDVKNCQGNGIKSLVKRLSNIDTFTYIMLHAAFVGGNTHANRHYVGRVINNVTCYDITSSYPYTQLTGRFPMKPFRMVMASLEHLELDDKFAYLLDVTFTNIRLADFYDGMPNISLSKCLELAPEHTTDNGRILDAGYLRIILTDVEYHIIEKHYIWDKRTFNVAMYSKYGELPSCIKSVIVNYFHNKCTLKGVDDYLYRKSKNKLNAIYGMSAFDVGKKRYTFDGEDYQEDKRTLPEILEETLGHGTQAEPYMWGVWTTANARANLDEVIRLSGDRFIYCDTDSVYCLGELDLSTLNESIKKKSSLYKVVHKGKSYYMGVWETDKRCKQFKTLGAKKYCYIDEDEKIHTVTSGVSKKAGVKNIDEYAIGHIFKNASNTAWHTDEEITLTIDGHTLIIPSNIYIESSDYTLGITLEYMEVLKLISGGEPPHKYEE